MKLLTALVVVCVFVASFVQCTPHDQEPTYPSSGDILRKEQTNAKICANVARSTVALESLTVITDTRLTPLLREVINGLFVLYPELLHEHFNVTKIMTPSGDTWYDVHKPDATKLPGVPCMDKIDALTDLANRKLLQAIAEGPSRETLRMLSGRLVKVLGVRELVHAWEAAGEEDIPAVMDKFWDVEAGWWTWAR